LLPWRQKDIFDGSPIARYIMPSWLSWLVMLLFVGAAGYLIYLTVNMSGQVFAVWGEQTLLTQAIIALLAVLSVFNAALLIYVVVFVGGKMLAGGKMPLITLAGLVFFAFLDWLLVVWFWDPGYLYGIGWQNTTSMVFMIIMYALAAAIYFGFSAYRKRQGIDVDKVYKEIPVE
jgi:glucan phosphoethanolaminetransferase (alkaline phosphatase superfamily)